MGVPVLLAVLWADWDLQLDPMRGEAVDVGAEQAAEGLGGQCHPGLVERWWHRILHERGSGPELVEQVLVEGHQPALGDPAAGDAEHPDGLPVS